MKLKVKQKSVPSHLVGVDDQVEAVLELLTLKLLMYGMLESMEWVVSVRQLLLKLSSTSSLVTLMDVASCWTFEKRHDEMVSNICRNNC